MNVCIIMVTIQSIVPRGELLPKPEDCAKSHLFTYAHKRKVKEVRQNSY